MFFWYAYRIWFYLTLELNYWEMLRSHRTKITTDTWTCTWHSFWLWGQQQKTGKVMKCSKKHFSVTMTAQEHLECVCCREEATTSAFLRTQQHRRSRQSTKLQDGEPRLLSPTLLYQSIWLNVKYSHYLPFCHNMCVLSSSIHPSLHLFEILSTFSWLWPKPCIVRSEWPWTFTSDN